MTFIDLTLAPDQVVDLDIEPTQPIDLVLSVGPQGPAGPEGPQGPPGVDGEALNQSYIHTQNATSDTWIVQHNLGYYPAITVVDSGGTTIIGEVTHDSPNQATVRFSFAFSGKIYAS